MAQDQEPQARTLISTSARALSGACQHVARLRQGLVTILACKFEHALAGMLTSGGLKGRSVLKCLHSIPYRDGFEAVPLAADPDEAIRWFVVEDDGRVA
jgi:hypothetical protein